MQRYDYFLRFIKRRY